MESEANFTRTIQTLQTRIARTQLAFALLIAIMALALIWRTRPAETLRAREFVLTDEHGQILARLGHASSETCLQLGGRKPSSAYLCVGDDYGSSLYLSNYQGADRAYLSPGSPNLDPALIISQGYGSNLIAGSLGKGVRLVVGHSNEENSAIISVQDAGPTLRALGPSGRPLWKAP